MPNPRPTASLFTQVDISANSQSNADLQKLSLDELQVQLLREILASQDRQNELLEELLTQMAAPQRQRNQELANWRQANPTLSKACRSAAESLGKVQSEFLQNLTLEVQENAENMLDGGEFMLSEFVDRFGPRLAHLNGVLQVLTQLGVAPTNNGNTPTQQ